MSDASDWSCCITPFERLECCTMNPGNANGEAYSVCYFRVGSQDEAGAGVVNA